MHNRFFPTNPMALDDLNYKRRNNFDSERKLTDETKVKSSEVRNRFLNLRLTDRPSEFDFNATQNTPHNLVKQPYFKPCKGKILPHRCSQSKPSNKSVVGMKNNFLLHEALVRGQDSTAIKLKCNISVEFDVLTPNVCGFLLSRLFYYILHMKGQIPNLIHPVETSIKRVHQRIQSLPKQNSIWAKWRQQKEREKLLSLVDTISTYDETVKNLSAELRTGAVDEVVLSVGEDSDLYCIRLPRLEFTHQDSNHRRDKYALQLLRSISSSPDFQQILSQDCPPLKTCIFVKKNSANIGVDWLSPYDGFPDTWDPVNKVVIQFTCRPPSEPRICCENNLEASPLKESCSEELSWFKSKKVLQGCNVTA